MRRRLKEAFGVKTGRDSQRKDFDSLEAAVDFINSGIKKSEAETYILYNDDKEVIWLDKYRDENDDGVGYTVTRQEDKKSVAFNKDTGLSIAAASIENDEKLRAMVVKEAGRMKHYTEAAKLAKLTFVEDKSKESYIDFKTGCVHYNTDEQLNDAIEKLVSQIKAKTEALAIKKLNEFLAAYPEEEQAELTEGRSDADPTLTGYVDTVVKALKPLRDKAAEICKKVNLRVTPYGKSGDVTFYWHGKEGIRLMVATSDGLAVLTVDESFKNWEDLHAHLAGSTPKPEIPLLLEVRRHTHAVKGYYTASEARFSEDIAHGLRLVCNAIKSGDVEKAAQDAFSQADPSLRTTTESVNEEELNSAVLTESCDWFKVLDKLYS